MRIRESEASSVSIPGCSRLKASYMKRTCFADDRKMIILLLTFALMKPYRVSIFSGRGTSVHRWSSVLGVLVSAAS